MLVNMELPLSLVLLALSFLHAPQVYALSTRGSSSSSKRIASGWYAGWHAADVPDAFPLSDVSWSKYTHMAYAFAITSGSSPGVVLQSSDEELLPQFVDAAHEHNVTAILSIGGWTGSLYYSSLVGSAANRSSFVKTVSGLATKYNVDGFEFDWEYPGKQGIGCNVIAPNDTANMLAFLQELRTDAVGKSLVLSMPTFLTPFADASGAPSTDVSAFSDVLDYISIMNYDVSTYTNTVGVGPNAPLNSSCEASHVAGSAASSLSAWTAAGFPASKIVLGVPSYGHSFHVDKSIALVSNALTAFPVYNASEQPHGDAWDSDAGLDVCGNEVPIGGIWDFWGMVDGGFLTSGGVPQEGIDYRFDNCSQTPYVYNATSQVMVSYDNAQSFAAKGAFIADQGLAGFAMWETGGDYEDTLLDAITNAMAETSPPASSSSSSSSSTASSTSSSAGSNGSNGAGGSTTKTGGSSSLCVPFFLFAWTLFSCLALTFAS